MNVKSEPTWNESEYGVTSNSNQMDQSDGDSNLGPSLYLFDDLETLNLLLLQG
jgi:hypothetical protein